MSHGGKREGAGRKPVPNPLQPKSIRCTKEEYQYIRECLKELRIKIKLKNINKID